MAKLNLRDALNTSLTRTKQYIDTELAKKANSSHGTHVTYGGNGSATTVSRSDHTHRYLSLDGGTISGNIYFADVTSTTYPAKSTTLTWNGSTDGADIYYQVDASDKGRLVLNTRDDADCIIAFANKGTIISTIDNSGNFSGKAATATKATQDSAGQQINTTYIKGLSVSGKTITYTKGDGTTGTITTQDTNTTYNAATQSAAGLMSAADKTKLDGIATGANNYTHPSYTAKSAGFYKVTVDATGHVSSTTAVAKSDIEGLLTGEITTHTHSYIPLAGNPDAYSITGNLTFSDAGTSGGFKGIVGKCGANDYWRVGGLGVASNDGRMEIATSDDGNEPIYVRQYTGVYSTLVRTATLLDASGNTFFPGSITTGNKVTMQYNSTSESLDFIFI